ncbi:hypothetical protein HBI04_208170 [Parastagonospora nodorum]|nr:hypothetical protein HBI04_208170 [Parastagonospora nodorum]
MSRLIKLTCLDVSLCSSFYTSKDCGLSLVAAAWKAKFDKVPAHTVATIF